MDEQIFQNYQDADPRVVRFIGMILSELKSTRTEITDYTRIILEMMIPQLILYYRSADSVKDVAVSSKDVYNRVSKAPEITVLQKTNDQILALMDKISLSPLSAARVKKLMSTTSSDVQAEDILADLIK